MQPTSVHLAPQGGIHKMWDLVVTICNTYKVAEAHGKLVYLKGQEIA